MTLTTGMLISGKMSIGIETTETRPRTAINSARTTNVYGRRSASRTIHIFVCLWETRMTPQEHDGQTFQQESARPFQEGPWPRSGGLRILAKIAHATDAPRALSIWKSTSVDCF